MTARLTTIDMTNAPVAAWDSDGKGNGPFVLATSATSPGTASGTSSTGSTSGYSASASWTPAAAAYTAGDVMSTAQTFTFRNADGVLFGGGAFRITTCKFFVYHTAIISGETNYRAHLYNVTPPSALADNDAWDLPSGDRASYLGYVECGTPVDLGSTLYVQTTDLDLDIIVPTTGIVYAYLRTIGGFTATAAARVARIHGYAL